jgi:alanyl-tRNA synthetase
MNNGNLFRHVAKVTEAGVGEFKKRLVHWVRLNETIFHPQGGGQPADKGTIGKINVIHVNKDRSEKIDEFGITHYLDLDGDKPSPFKEGDEVELEVEPAARLLHARLHTGGHLLSDVVNQVTKSALTGFMGNHSPSDTYVKFRIAEGAEVNLEEIKKEAQRITQEMIEGKVPVEVTRTSEGVRAIQIGNYTPVPCGGTHIANLEKLIQLEVKAASLNKKEQTVTIKYAVPLN